MSAIDAIARENAIFFEVPFIEIGLRTAGNCHGPTRTACNPSTGDDS